MAMLCPGLVSASVHLLSKITCSSSGGWRVLCFEAVVGKSSQIGFLVPVLAVRKDTAPRTICST